MQSITFLKSSLINEGKKKSERWYYSIKSHRKLAWNRTAIPVQPPVHLPVSWASTCPFKFRSGIQLYWQKKAKQSKGLGKEVRPTQQLLKLKLISQFYYLLLRKLTVFYIYISFSRSSCHSFLCSLLIKQLSVTSSTYNCWLKMSCKQGLSAPLPIPKSRFFPNRFVNRCGTFWMEPPSSRSTPVRGFLLPVAFVAYTCDRLAIAWVISQRLANSSLSLC